MFRWGHGETRDMIVQARAWREEGHDCSVSGMKKTGRIVQAWAWRELGHVCSGTGMEKRGISVQARAWRRGALVFKRGHGEEGH